MENNVVYIDEQSDLDVCVKKLLTQPAIAIDLEFDKNHYQYGFTLCLMQLFDGETCYLIDPLGALDITPIYPVLESQKIEKLCFAFDEDMRLLFQMGVRVKNLLDLSVAHMLTGEDSLSLSNTLEHVLDREAQKSQQRSNWVKRPLTDDQCYYAAEDVVHLFDLKAVLLDQLEVLNRTNWLAEEMDAFENRDWTASKHNAKVQKEKKQLTKQQWMRFTDLLEYRESLAAQMNKPTYRIWDQNNCLELAKNPERMEQILNNKKLHPRLRRPKVTQQIKAIIEASNADFNALNFADDTPALSPLTAEDKMLRSRNKQRLNNIKNDFVAPVKEEMKRNYGAPLTNYVLSNRKVKELVLGDLELLNYQKKMISSSAEKIGVSCPKELL
ncbi:MAG: hypothetical protein ACQERC_03995 [Bacteroidota bacterium]